VFHTNCNYLLHSQNHNPLTKSFYCPLEFVFKFDQPKGFLYVDLWGSYVFYFIYIYIYIYILIYDYMILFFNSFPSVFCSCISLNHVKLIYKIHCSLLLLSMRFFKEFSLAAEKAHENWKRK
jgi:hypothetical protein